MTKTSRRNAIIVSVLIVALCAAVIGGATFALYSAGDTHNIQVSSGDISLTSTVTLESASSTPDGGEAVALEVVDNSKTTFTPGGNVVVNNGDITITNIGQGDSATFKAVLSMSYTINMKYSLVLKTEGDNEFLRNNLNVTVGDETYTLADGDVYIIPWKEAAKVDGSGKKSEEATATFSISMPWDVQGDSTGNSINLSLVASGVQVNALAVSDNQQGESEYYVTNQDELNRAIAAMQDGDSLYLAGEESDWSTANITFDDSKGISVYGSNVGTLTVNAPNGTIEYYIEYTDKIDSAIVADNSLHIYGQVGNATVNDGRIVFESGSSVTTVTAQPATDQNVTVVIAQNSTIGTSVSVNTAAANSSAKVEIAESVTVPSLNVEGSGKVDIDNNGIIKESTVSGDSSSVSINSNVTDEASLRAALNAGGGIKLLNDITVEVPDISNPESELIPMLTVEKDTTLDMNGKTLSYSVIPGVPYEYTPSILCVSGASVVINGDGTIDAEAGYNNAFGINIIDNGSLTINGGTYYGSMTAVQVQSGSLVINDGFFDLATTIKTAAPNWARYIINAIDGSWEDGSSTITLNGGTYGYDYSISPEANGELYLPEGYGVVKEGDYYTVKEIATNPDDEYLAGSATALNSLIKAGAKNIVISSDFNIGTAGSDAIGVSITSGTYNIDFNGYMLTNVGTGSAFAISGKETYVTLQDSSSAQMGGIYGGKGGGNVAIAVSGSAKVDIYGGNYNVGPDNNNEGNSCIYIFGGVGSGGNVTIYDGTFSSEAMWNGKYYVLNTENSTDGYIYVRGGNFLHFDPANGDDTSPSNPVVQSSYLAEGYTSVQAGDYYVVIEGENGSYLAATDDAVANGQALVQAIEEAEDGSSLLLGKGTYELSSTLTINKNLTILGNGSTITGNANLIVAAANYKIAIKNLVFASKTKGVQAVTANGDVTIEDCSTTNSNIAHLVYVNSSATNVVIKNCTSSRPWANLEEQNENCSVTFEGNTFTNAFGVYAVTCVDHIYNVTFTNNTSTKGMAFIKVTSSLSRVENVKFEDNVINNGILGSTGLIYINNVAEAESVIDNAIESGDILGVVKTKVEGKDSYIYTQI